MLECTQQASSASCSSNSSTDPVITAQNLSGIVLGKANLRHSLQLQWWEVLLCSGKCLGYVLQISLSETLVWRAAEMVQRLDLTSLTAPEDEEHTEAATDVPMQMSLVSISSLAAKVRYADSIFAVPVSKIAQSLQAMRCEVGAQFASAHGHAMCAACWLSHRFNHTTHVPKLQLCLQLAYVSS